MELHPVIGVVFNNLRTGVLVEDETNKIILANRRFYELFGIPESISLLGLDCGVAAQSAKDLFSDPDSFIQRVQHLLIDGAVVIGDVLRLSDGRVFHRDYIPIHDERGYRGNLWQYQDMTAEYTLQDQLSAARESAEQASRSKSDFLADFSHEFRTPLNAISGVTDLMSDRDLPEESHRLMRILRGNVDALLALVTDVLDISRVESGQVALQSEEFDLVALVEDAVESSAARADAKGIALYCFIEKGFTASFRGDAVRIRQIAFNLISNAIKFTKEGYVTVSLRGSRDASGSWTVRLLVRDTGIGMNLKQQSRLFERFRQVHDSGNRGLGGTGLGLTITRSLTQLLGGTIRVRSRAGRGTTVSVTFSLPEGEGRDSATSSESSQSVKQVLLWATNKMLAAMCKQTLEHLNVSCNLVKTTEDFLERLQSNSQTLAFVETSLWLSLPASARDSMQQSIVAAGVKVIFAGAWETRVEWSKNASKECKYVCVPFRRTTLARMLEGSLIKDFDTYIQDSDSLYTQAKHEGQRRSGERVGILVVEDSPDNQLLMRSFLEKAGYRVDIAPDGSSAISLVKLRNHKLIFMDLDLPDQSGLECTTQIRRWEREQGLSEVPLVALTAHAIRGVREQCLAVGMNDYLTKPIRYSTLIETVQRFVDTSKEYQRLASIRPTQQLQSIPEIERRAALVGLEPELLVAYIANRQADLAQLGSASTKHDFETIRRLGHRMKGSGGSYGLTDISHIGAQLEQYACEQELRGIQAAIKDLAGVLASFAR